MGYLMRIVLLGVLILLGGCKQSVELHRNLSEEDANEVIAELAFKHIDADKAVTKEGITVSVDVADMARAVRLLEAAGLPRKARANMGEVFRKEGVISSPLEERARYIYALSQELESTISQIDGVLVARVHVVLPERVAPGEPVQPASAAVFIKHRPDLDPDVIRPRIERLVRTSIPGLSDKKDKMSVVFVPATVYREQMQLVYFGPFLIKKDDVSFWQGVVVSTVVVLLLLLGVLTIWLKQEWRQAVFGRFIPAKTES
ncbi:type III secretion system inner membrane ring lipoprotein SctJ [Vibrio mangrovi]|uniref:Lipoprotein n=1 Tax=Vibrio mangrovi TaxID=474394 RepID=A0A1Y6IZQ2_9VIBR|nr:type III secretion inner membrane ring lipoprotein SctJ [Vibrio mangrovi]MDW6001951.1 type III secretion inner membrane ring lipoprotein SctJ [Vibrio mangrovi]SMS02501.1 Yop proteins translocation lipoprotein J precursor [Vibrio mangrovi]